MECIGKHATVTAARNSANVGLSGLVVDETRATLQLQTARGIRTIIKHNVTLTFPSQTIAGAALVGTVHERIKRG